MAAETELPVYARATHAPWREILRQRWSGRRDRALVLRDRTGLHHLSGNRRGAAATDGPETGLEAPGTGRTGLRGYESAYVVHLDERAGTRSVVVPTEYGTEALEIHVLWWVHDAVQVVETRTVRGWYPVRKDLDARMRQLGASFAAAGHRLGATEVMQYLATPHKLAHCGLGYRVTDVSARENGTELWLGGTDGTAVPPAWGDRSREEYEFCKRAVADGPAALAGLWLARHPDEVAQVLEWAVNHADLLRGETTWQDSVAGLLGKLTAQEQQELSRLLRDRLVALGRPVPGPQGGGGGGPIGQRVGVRVNGWAGGVANGTVV